MLGTKGTGGGCAGGVGEVVNHEWRSCGVGGVGCVASPAPAVARSPSSNLAKFRSDSPPSLGEELPPNGFGSRGESLWNLAKFELGLREGILLYSILPPVAQVPAVARSSSSNLAKFRSDSPPSLGEELPPNGFGSRGESLWNLAKFELGLREGESTSWPQGAHPRHPFQPRARVQRVRKSPITAATNPQRGCTGCACRLNTRETKSQAFGNASTPRHVREKWASWHSTQQTQTERCAALDNITLGPCFILSSKPLHMPRRLERLELLALFLDVLGDHAPNQDNGHQQRAVHRFVGHGGEERLPLARTPVDVLLDGFP